MKLSPLSTAAAAAALLLTATGAFAQSSKFAAAWDDEPRIVEAHAEVLEDGSVDSACFGGVGDGSSQHPCILAEALLTRIDVPQQKDLLIGVSGQIGLHTFTQAKGKSTDTTIGKASASAGAVVRVELRDPVTGDVVQMAAPGPVTFAARLQELSVDVVDTDVEFLTEVTVGLMIETTAAHHFNFVAVDLLQGDYDVVAVFDLSAFAEVVGEDAIANAKVTLGPRMVTAQEVRAAKGSLVAFD